MSFQRWSGGSSYVRPALPRRRRRPALPPANRFMPATTPQVEPLSAVLAERSGGWRAGFASLSVAGCRTDRPCVQAATEGEPTATGCRWPWSGARSRHGRESGFVRGRPWTTGDTARVNRGRNAGLTPPQTDNSCGLKGLWERSGGPDGGRTRDLVNAIHARSQLRHWPSRVHSIRMPSGNQPTPAGGPGGPARGGATPKHRR